MATLDQQRQALTDAGALCAQAAENCIQAAQAFAFPGGNPDPNDPPSQDALGVASALAGIAAQAAQAADAMTAARQRLEGLT